MRKESLAVIAAAALGIGLPICAGAATAPRTTVTSMAKLPAPLPYPYTDNADARLAVSQAFARAKASGKRVLIEFGGNWCPDCRILAGVMQLPEVKGFVAKHYEIVTVDVGRFDRNLDVVSKFGIAKLQGVPTVVIADADGKAINVTNSADLDNARAMTPQGIADWLARWANGP